MQALDGELIAGGAGLGDDARLGSPELAAGIGDFVGELADLGIGLHRSGFGFGGLLERNIFLLRQHDDIVAAAELGQIGFGVFQLPLIAIGLALEELIRSGRDADFEMLFEVEVSEVDENADGLVRVGIGVFHEDDIGLTDGRHLEIVLQAFDGIFDGNRLISQVLPSIKPAFGDDLLHEVVAGEQLYFGIDFGCADFAAIAGAVVALRGDDHVGALALDQDLHVGLIPFGHGERGGDAPAQTRSRRTVTRICAQRRGRMAANRRVKLGWDHWGT